MRNIRILKSGMVFFMLAFFGCGGGGGGGSSSSSNTNVVTASTIISGTASKGLISNGTVTAYKIVSGVKGDVVASGKTKSDGTYSLDLGSYSGPTILEISGGTYTDEATNTTLPLSAPLRAVVSGVSGTVSVSVTPLTDLAYQLAGSSLTTTAIDSANKEVSNIFNVYDIVKTQPVSPTKSVLDALPPTTQGQDQRDYTLALAAFSQLATTQISVADTVTYLKNNISNATLTTAAANAIQSAATAYFKPATINPNNTTGVTDVTTTNLVNIVSRQMKVILSTSGSLPSGNSIKGMQFEINLPTGVTVKSGADGVPANYLQVSGVAMSASNPNIIGNLTGSRLLINFTSSGGILTGEFATLTCDLADNIAVPAIVSFSITPGYKISDLLLNSGTINLSTVTIAVSSVAIK